MKELLRTNDAVRLSFLQSLLKDSGIESLVLDHHTSLVEGSIGAIPRRLSGRATGLPSRLLGSRGGRRSHAMSEHPAEEPTFTEDRLLGGRIRLQQPAAGYRVAIDPVFLAAAVPAEPHQLVLDVGCGAGAAMLCLAARVPHSRLVGLEMHRDLVRLAGDNIILNGLEARASVMIGDLLHPPPRLSPGAFDHVMANPPFHRRGDAEPAAAFGKSAATIEGDADLADWVRFALAMVRSKGTVTFIHRADRIDALLGQIAGRAGEVVVFPLWPGEGRAASRILVRVRKQVSAPARLAAGLVLHDPDGGLSAGAEGVLREGRGLDL